MPDPKFREAVRSLRSGITGIKAVILIGPDGVALDYLSWDPDFDVGTFASEYAMLLRIAGRTSKDTGSGELHEHISLCERNIAIARCFLNGFCLVLIADVHAQVGKARYELKVAVRQIERIMEKSGV